MNSIKTLGDLKKSGWKSRSVKEEMRENLISALRNGVKLFEEIHGYDFTVLPQLTNAILAKHDILLLGLRGQAKTRLLRSLTSLLDENMPVIDGAPLNDDPFDPISRAGREIVAVKGDDTPLRWMHRSERYIEKLATPDTTVADLIGDIDPIKAASRKLDLSDEHVIHYGLIPRANRCLFVINELPDLQPRIQVALLNIMQERDIQIRGFNVRIPLDISIHFSANPEDYTNRGNIITPLKDRIDAQIITHYPDDVKIGMTITGQEAWTQRGSNQVQIPVIVREIVEQIAIEARKSEFIDQKSGVSARMPISILEAVVSSAEMRLLKTGENELQIRLADVYQAIPAITGKVELVYEGEQEGAQKVAQHLIGKAVETVFRTYLPAPQKRAKSGTEDVYKKIVTWFSAGNRIKSSLLSTNAAHQRVFDEVDGLQDVAEQAVKKWRVDSILIFKELILEGLHQCSFLSREVVLGQTFYTDLAGSLLGNILPDNESELDS